MSASAGVPERRAMARAARRLSCEIVERGARHTAVVLDLSETGLFVRTNAAPAPGTPVRLVVRRPGGEVWEIEARVARIRERGKGDAMVTSRGLGLELVEAPPGYFRFLAALRGDG
jgi:predicted phosphoribosyltransferase